MLSYLYCRTIRRQHSWNIAAKTVEKGYDFRQIKYLLCEFLAFSRGGAYILKSGLTKYRHPDDMIFFLSLL